jgi:hypothetical protein
MSTQSFEINSEWVERVEKRLSYKDSKSEWYRHAVIQTAHVDRLLEEKFGPSEYEQRQEFVVETIERALKDSE